MAANEHSHKGQPTTQVNSEPASGSSAPHPPPQPVVRTVPLSTSVLDSHIAPPQSDIVLASQRGDLAAIKELIESGKATVNDRDGQNV